MIKSLPSRDASQTAVMVLFKDPLVRMGIAATLGTSGSFVVHVVDDASMHDPDGCLPDALAGAHVVVADYDRGLAVARWLRGAATSRSSPSPKLMIVTHRDGEAEVRRALENGIHGYLSLDCHSHEMIDGVIA